MDKTLDAAREYLRRGWSIIPTNPADKEAAVRWMRYQRKPPSEATVRRWYADGARGVAVVCGAVSRGLFCRDFDTMDGYERWVAVHPELAQQLPTVVTKRGRHVYGTVSAESLAAVRERVGKPSGTGAIRLADGELRADSGCYNLLPPSTHPSGVPYRWEVPLPDGPIPKIDLLNCGFLDSIYTEHTESAENTGTLRAHRNTQAIEGGARDFVKTHPSGGLTPEMQLAITRSLPSGPGQRHRHVFELARHLKAIPNLQDASAVDLEHIVAEWHSRALPAIRTKPFEETMIDFLKAWPRVRFAAGEEPLAGLFQKAAAADPPACASRYEQPALRLLVSLCRELQAAAGDGPFFLSCRTAGKLLDAHYTTTNGWLLLLVAHKVLELVEKGDRKTRRASIYRYLGS